MASFGYGLYVDRQAARSSPSTTSGNSARSLALTARACSKWPRSARPTAELDSCARPSSSPYGPETKSGPKFRKSAGSHSKAVRLASGDREAQ
jgi:hypothetical protein